MSNNFQALGGPGNNPGNNPIGLPNNCLTNGAGMQGVASQAHETSGNYFTFFQGSGINFVRTSEQYTWPMLETTKGVYSFNFSYSDSFVSIATSNGGKVLYALRYNNPLYFDWDSTASYPQFGFANSSGTASSFGTGTGISTFAYYSLQNYNFNNPPSLNTSTAFWQLITPYWTSVTTYGIGSFVVYQNPTGISSFFYSKISNNIGIAPTTATDNTWALTNIFSQSPRTANNYNPYNLYFAGPQIGFSTIFSWGTNYNGFYNFGYLQSFQSNTQCQGFAGYCSAIINRYRGLGIMYEISNEPDDLASFWLPSPSFSTSLLGIQSFALSYLNTFTAVSNKIRSVPAIASEYLVACAMSAKNTYWLDYLCNGSLGTSILYYCDAVSIHNYSGLYGLNPESTTYWYTSHIKNLINQYSPIGTSPVPIISSEWGFASPNGMGQSSTTIVSAGGFNTQYAVYNITSYPASPYEAVAPAGTGNTNLLQNTNGIGVSWRTYNNTNGYWMASGNSGVNYNYYGGSAINGFNPTAQPTACLDPNGTMLAWQFSDPDYTTTNAGPTSYQLISSGTFFIAQTANYWVDQAFYVMSAWFRTNPQPGQYSTFPITMQLGNLSNGPNSVTFNINPTWTRYSFLIQYGNGDVTGGSSRGWFQVTRYGVSVGLTSYQWQMAFPQVEQININNIPSAYQTGMGSAMYQIQANYVARAFLQDKQDGIIAKAYYFYQDSPSAGNYGLVQADSGTNTWTTAIKKPAWYAMQALSGYSNTITRYTRHFGSTGGNYLNNPAQIGYTGVNTVWTAQLSTSPSIGNGLLMYIVAKNSLPITSIVLGGTNQTFTGIASTSAGGNRFIYVYALTYALNGAGTTVTINMSSGSNNNLFCTYTEEIAGLSILNPVDTMSSNSGLSTSIYDTLKAPITTISSAYWVNIYCYRNGLPNSDPYPVTIGGNYTSTELINIPPNYITQGLGGWSGVSTGVSTLSDTLGMVVVYRPSNFLGQPGGRVQDFYGYTNDFAALALSLKITGSTPDPTYNSSYGGIFNFNGSSNYMYFSTLNLPYGVSSGTIAAWARTNTISGGNAWIFSYGNPANFQSRSIGINGNTYYYSGYTDSVSYTGVSLNTWFYIAGVFDGTNATLYVNGVAVSSAVKSSWNTVQNNAQIGRQTNGSEYWSGDIGDIEVYNRALSANEILNNYNYGLNRF
jgi:hypothetical protein